jgi:cyanate permease
VLLFDSVFAIVSMSALALFLLRRPEFGSAIEPLEHPGSLRGTLSDPFIRTVAVLAFVGFGTFTSYMTWLQALLAPAGIAADDAGIMLIGFVIAGIAGAMLFPSWAARRKLEFRLLSATVVTGSIVCLLLALYPRVGVGMTGIPLLGLLQLSTLPVIMEMTERRAGSAAGLASALVFMSGNVGATVVSMVVQHLVERPQMAFLFMGAITALSGPLLYLLRHLSLTSSGRSAVERAA